MCVIRIFFAILLIATISVPAYTQKSKSQLQKEKQENIKKIKEAEKILAQTTGKKKSTVGQLNALRQRIKVQENLIGSLRKELLLLDEEIGENNLIIEALQEDLDQLKEEYAQMVYAAHKNNKGHNNLTFIFSATSFNQLLMRLKYMEQYAESRQKQVIQIEKVQQVLADRTAVIESRKSEKSILISEQLAENKGLEKLKSNQQSVIKSLRDQEQSIKQDLEDWKKANAKLDKYINDIIKEEIARAARAEKKASEAAVKLSNNFAENKSKLPWPVSGFVTQQFGKQKHPVLKNIVLNNTGVNIQTKKDEKVRSIFDGKVSTVAFVGLVGNTIIVKHGEYFTVYAGLKDVFVKQGQNVLVNQEIGTILTNKDRTSQLKFEIRKGTSALDPQLWLNKN